MRTVLAFALDRLARSGIRDTFEVVDELRRARCELLTVSDPFSLEGPAADVVIAVLAWAAQMERAKIGERIAAARVRVEAAGGRWGRPRKFGPADVERARGLARGGHSGREISALLNMPRSTVRDVLGEKGAYARAPARRRK